jgi:zinc transport system substrate-binding protein
METPMSRKLLTLSLAATLMGGTAYADTPQVAVDIAPLHSLVARVMDGVGTPDLIVQPGASPHEYSLRPSEAAALQNADLVFWIGPDLTPWLGDTIETLAPDAAVTTLLETDGTIELEFREGALFEAHEHDEHGEEDGHEDHEEHADEGHEDHGDEEAGHEGHDHGAHDPHAWLSPKMQ